MDVETFYCMYVEHDCDEATCPYYVKENGRCVFEDRWDSSPVSEWDGIEKALENIMRERMEKNGREPSIYCSSTGDGYGTEFRSESSRSG